METLISIKGKLSCILLLSVFFSVSGCSTVKTMNTPAESRKQQAKTSLLSHYEKHKLFRRSQMYPGNPDPYYQLGCYYQARGEDGKAIKEFKKVILIDPAYVKAYNRIGISYDRVKGFSKAVISYRTALEHDPNLYYVYNNMGFSYALQGDYDMAIELLKKGIALKKESPHLHNNLGRVYGLTGEYDKAMEEFRMGGDETLAYYYLGRLYYEKGMQDEAKACYSEILRMNPSFSDSHKGLNFPDILDNIQKDIKEKRPDISSKINLDNTYIEEDETERGSGKFGCIAPMTGPLSEYGERMVRGVMMAIDEYNEIHGSSVSLVLLDSMGKPDIAEECVEVMAYQEKVSAIIGPLLTDTTSSAAKMAEKIGIPLFTPTASKPDLPGDGGFIFSNRLGNNDQADALANYAFEEIGLTSFGIFSPSNIYGLEMADFFTNKIKDLGGNIEIIEFYNPEETDFREQVLRINRAKPEAIFIPDSYKNIILIVPQIFFYDSEEDEYEKPGPVQLLGTDGWYNEKLIEEIKSYADGTIVSVGFYPESMDSRVNLFISKFTDMYGEQPDIISAQSYDTANMLLEASEGGRVSWNLTRERLLHLHDFPCVSGMTTMLSSGNAKKEVTLLKIEDEMFVPAEEFDPI